MSTPHPPRKFAPMPIEQSTKSSRQRSPSKEESAPKRRFAPDLVESTSKSSRVTKQDDAPKPRRFVPEIVEEAQKSSKSRNGARSGSDSPHIRFKPEPISTTHRSRRSTPDEDDEPVSPGSQGARTQEPRKFAPILLDTARRSRRAGSGSSSISHDDRTESGFNLHAQEHQQHISSKRRSTAGSETVPEHSEIDSSAPSITRANSGDLRRNICIDGTAPARPVAPSSRSHSFRMPDLDTIESSESEREDSNTSSTSTSPGPTGSPITASDSSFEFYMHATRIRESVDENFTHYLLDLERKKAQQRLEEQALAAFPNADFGYEPPHHYVNNDDDSDEMEIEDRPVTFEGHEDDLIDFARRRESTMPMSWEQKELQRHAEQIQRDRPPNQPPAKKESSHSPWWRPGAFAAFQDQTDKEIKSMRDRARPPMLGGDLIFPRCPSPEPARFDTTQRPMRNAGGSQAGSRQPSEDGGLWRAPDSPTLIRITSTKSTASTASPIDGKGLWGGFCVNEGSRPGSAGGLFASKIPAGLITPAVERANPFEQPGPFASGRNGTKSGAQTPRTPKETYHDPPDLNRIDSVLVTERELDAHMAREFPDAFITQVYNYLSLGYPSLARPFDAELAKISRIPLSDLRRDDLKAQASPRGYIRLGPDFEGGGGGGGGDQGSVLLGGEEGCLRWHALKLYVREWARQEQNMVQYEALPGEGNWGTSARRGSWGI